MKTINLHNTWHLGDSVFAIHHLNTYINDDITFNYYIHQKYINELSQHITNPNVKLYPLEYKPLHSYSTWVGEDRYYWNVLPTVNYNFDLFYVKYFNYFSSMLDIPCYIHEKEDMLYRVETKKDLNEKYDLLLVNSIPLSRQIHYDAVEFNNYCYHLDKKGVKFITTLKVGNYPCTLDNNLSIVDIGKIAANSDNIIAVNTSPIISTFNIWNVDTVKNWFVLDEKVTYSFRPNIKRLSNIRQMYYFI